MKGNPFIGIGRGLTAPPFHTIRLRNDAMAGQAVRTGPLQRRVNVLGGSADQGSIQIQGNKSPSDVK
jgi:hypothetical protein